MIDRVRTFSGYREYPKYAMLDFQEIDQTQVAVVGGKGALLGELSRIEGTSTHSS